MKNTTQVILFLMSFFYQTMVFSNQSDEDKETDSLILMIAPFPEYDFSEDTQETKIQKEKEKGECQYFLTTGLENDDFIVSGDDRGYTHGHLTSIIRSCDSGEDLIFSLDSRVFTQFSHLEFPSPDRVALAFRFEEENRLTIKFTDRRNFKKPYKTIGLLVGHLSRNRLRFAGQEQKAFHEVFNNVKIIGYRKIRDGRMRRLIAGTDGNQMQSMSLFDEVFEYTYVEEDKNSVFVGGKFALGKIYPLGDLKEICDRYCVEYFRTEVGMELISLKHASNAYIFLEINKTLPQPIEAVSIFASVKVQKHESTNGLYRESSAGLKFDLFGLQLQYALKARNLLPEEDRFIEYDSDEDILMYLGVTIPVSL